MFFTKDIGIDLGTANTLVFLKGKGIVLREPSVVAVDSTNGRMLAVGEDAKQMIGRTPGNITAIRPMKDGVIADFEYTRGMLKYYIEKVLQTRSVLNRIRVVICAPSCITAVEERAIREAALAAGAKEAYLIEEPMAAAIGANMPVYEPTGNMIVDIGGGTSEVAIISLGGVVTITSIRVAGDEMDEVIVAYIKKHYNLAIGISMAEDIKINIGSAYLTEEDRGIEYQVRGRDLLTGLPKTIAISPKEVAVALAEPVGLIIENVKACLEKAPPELAADIMDRGIMMAGGGSLLKGLPKLLSMETHIPVHLAESPLDAVAMGTGKVLDNMDALHSVKNWATKKI